MLRMANLKISTGTRGTRDLEGGRAHGLWWALIGVVRRLRLGFPHPLASTLRARKLPQVEREPHARRPSERNLRSISLSSLSAHHRSVQQGLQLADLTQPSKCL